MRPARSFEEISTTGLSFGVAGAAFVAAVLGHEFAHAAAWRVLGGEGIRVGIGRTAIEGALPRGDATDAALVLAAGPVASLVVAVVGIACWRLLHPPRLAWWHLGLFWLVAASASNVAWSMLAARAGTDAGRLLAIVDASAVAETVVSAIGLVLLVALGWWARRALASARIATRGGASSAVLVAGWLGGVVVPLSLVVGDGSGWHALGAGFFVLAAVLLPPRIDGADAGMGTVSTTPIQVAFAVAAGLVAWGGAWLIERGPGVPIG